MRGLLEEYMGSRKQSKDPVTKELKKYTLERGRVS